MYWLVVFFFIVAPVLPNVPVSSLPETLSYNTISIKFTIPSIAYDPEQYHIQYGTSSDNLNKISTTISGNTDLNTKNENFEIILNYLDHNTVYYYRIVANNSLGTVKTSVKTFQTPRIRELLCYYNVVYCFKILLFYRVSSSQGGSLCRLW